MMLIRGLIVDGRVVNTKVKTPLDNLIKQLKNSTKTSQRRHPRWKSMKNPPSDLRDVLVYANGKMWIAWYVGFGQWENDGEQGQYWRELPISPFHKKKK